MDGMIAAAESQSAEADSEPVAQVETPEESTNNVQSSETLTENVPSQPAPSESAEPADSIPEEPPGDLAAPDHVSSSTESYPGRNGLPSINHQSVLIPNMEPYLEEGSLDGAPKEFQDPSSSNSNPPSDSDSKTAIDSSNQPDTPQDSMGPSLPPESSPNDEDSSHINEPEVEEEPVATLPEAESNPQLEESPPLEPSNEPNNGETDQVSSLMEEPVQEELNPVGNSAPEEVNGVDSSTVEAPPPPPPPPEDQEQPSESNVEEETAQVESEEPAIDSSSYAVASTVEPDESNVEAADPAPIEEAAPIDPPSDEFEEAAPVNPSSDEFEEAAPTNPPSDEQQYEEEQQEYPAAESSEGAVPVEPATVCEADSSAAGMEETAGYDPDEMDSSQQNVYVVEGEQQSGSLTPFHNSDTAMLVEMAPLATESYVNSQVLKFLIKLIEKYYKIYY